MNVPWHDDTTKSCELDVIPEEDRWVAHCAWLKHSWTCQNRPEHQKMFTDASREAFIIRLNDQNQEIHELADPGWVKGVFGNSWSANDLTSESYWALGVLGILLSIFRRSGSNYHERGVRSIRPMFRHSHHATKRSTYERKPFTLPTLQERNMSWILGTAICSRL